MSLVQNKQVDEVLDYWFGNIKNGFTTEDKSNLWWGTSKRNDQYITRHFQDALTQASKQELEDWVDTPEGYVALIILLDQFSRNIYRGQSQAYAQDKLALSLCKDGIMQYVHSQLPYIQRVFFYLPLEHSENIEDQDQCVHLFEELLYSVDAQDKQKVQQYLDYAIIHRDIIASFGRFPHRNEVLGRKSTPAEKKYLAEGGQTFGQN